MAISFSVAFFVLVLLVKMASSQFPCQVNNSSYSGPPIPKIPDSFSMDIIHNVKVNNSIVSKTVNHLYVDAGRNLAVEGLSSAYYVAISEDMFSKHCLGKSYRHSLIRGTSHDPVM